MKLYIKHFAAILIMIAIGHTTFAYDFSAVAPSGQTLYFNVVDGGAQVTYQNPNCFPAYSNLVGSLTIPDSVSYLNNTLPVISIDDSAFRYCYDISHVYIPSTVNTIGNHAFQCCLYLSIIYFGGGVSSIGNHAFYNCQSLLYITLPSNITIIGSSAFALCKNLMMVDMTDSVTSIGNEAFLGCDSLCWIHISSGITSISEYTFFNCPSLRTINIPPSVTSINDYAFYNCQKLNTVNIYNGVINIGSFAFYGCDSLTSFTIPNTVNFIGAGTFSHTGLNAIEIPDNVSKVGAWAFDSCINLTSATIECDTINVGTFNDCQNLTTLTIGGGVEHIVYHAIYNCSSLDSVIMLPKTAPTANFNAFDDDTNRIFYIPCGSYESYSASNIYYPIQEPDANIHITVLSDDEIRGTANVIQSRGVDVTCDSIAVIQAIANEGYYFSRWSDGIDEEYRTLLLTCDTIIIAYFSSVCDSITLPYTANFMQCWTAEGGATIIDSNHASITNTGQKIMSPWMQSVVGNTYLAWTQQREGDCNYETEQFVITIENGNGVVQSWTESAGNWGSSAYSFTSPGGPIRVSFEYIGSTVVPSFQIRDVAIYNYQIETSIEGPVFARVGDTVTFASHAILQNNEMPDSYNWYMYKYTPNGSSWVDENDPSRTIVSRTDSTLVVVWNTLGRFSVTSSVSKWDVYQSHHASASDWQYINIVARNTYIEDSIYYTSQAKDTVIGCHPQLHNAILPGSVRIIKDSAFFNLANLSAVSLPDGLEHIGKMAFAWNQGITEITLPRGLVYIGDNAFWWDTNLVVINFNADSCRVMSPSTASDGNYWPVFIGCDNVTTINIGENVTCIPDRAFCYCSKLRGTLVIPDAVTYIGTSAFYHWYENWEAGNDTLQVVLGSGLTEIGDYAFGCPRAQLSSVISRATVPPTIYEQTFYRYEPEYTPVLWVPCGSTQAYRTAQHWNRIEDIREDCNSIENSSETKNMNVYSIYGNIVVSNAPDEIVTVYDMMGRVVLSTSITNENIHLPMPSSGVYMVKIGSLPAQKVVVMR